MDYDPGIDLPEIGIVVGTGSLGRAADLRIRLHNCGPAERAEAHRKQTRAFQKPAAMRNEDVLNLFRNRVGEAHATPVFPAAGEAASIILIARLIALCTRK